MPDFPWCGAMKACGCHPGLPGALLLPTNSQLPATALLSIPTTLLCVPSVPCIPRTPPSISPDSLPSHFPFLPSRNALTPDPPFQNGLTPLHVAAHYDNQKVALLLLEKGASPHATAKVSPPARHEGSLRGAGPGAASRLFIGVQRQQWRKKCVF